MKLDISQEGWSALRLVLLVGCFLILFAMRSECRADENDPVVRCTNGIEVRYFPNYTCPPSWWRI